MNQACSRSPRAALVLLAIASGLAITSTEAAAETSRAGIGMRIGITTGIGLEANYHLNRHFDLRASGNLGTLEYDDEDGATDYRAKLKYSAFAGFIDYKPFGGGFRITGGVYSNPLKLDLRASGEDEYEFGDGEYNGDLDVDGRVRLGDAAPYLGIGWGGTTNASGFGASLDVGVQFTQAPDARLVVNGRACDRGFDPNCDPNGPTGFDVNDGSPLAQAFQAEIDKEVRELEDDAKDFELMPVITLGLHYRFGGARSAAPAAPAAATVTTSAAAATVAERTPCKSCAAAAAVNANTVAPGSGLQSRPGAQAITLPRGVTLRPTAMPGTSNRYLAAGSRVEKSDRQRNASGTWWFVQSAEGLGGWVPEDELR